MEDTGQKGGAFEDGVDTREGFGNGALDGGGEGKREGEGLGTDGEKERVAGDAMVEIVAKTQEKRGRTGVGEQGVRLASEGTNGFAVNEPRGETGRGIQEDGEIAAAEGLGEFGCPLLAGMNRDLRAGELIAEESCEFQCDGVVTANGVATSEDEGAGHEGRRVSSRRWPSGARSWMWRGM